MAGDLRAHHARRVREGAGLKTGCLLSMEGVYFCRHIASGEMRV
jgi:hypothetical protein